MVLPLFFLLCGETYYILQEDKEIAFDYKEKFSVAGKKCIVTGAAQGLSRGMAEGLLENGAEVVLMDLQAEKLQSGENAGLRRSFLKGNIILL